MTAPSGTDQQVRCPTGPGPENSPITGCGSANITGPDPDGFYDCLDCGMWFRPDHAPAGRPGRTCRQQAGH